MPAVLGNGLQIDWRCTPLQALARWPASRPVFMLHSGRLDARWSRYSILAQPRGAIRFHNNRTEQRGLDDLALPKPWRDHPLFDLRALLDADAGRSLWLGYLGYDTARWIEHLPDGPAEDRGWPTMQFERCAGWLVYDGLQQTWSAHGSYETDGPPTLDAHGKTPAIFTAGPPEPKQTRADYEAGVQRILDYIAAGDAFQVNLTQRFTSTFAGSPRALFAALANISPAWYGCYGELTHFADNEPTRAIASTSPELFLDVDQQANVITRPIKGTCPSTMPAQTLRDSEKDAAELNMIIDLMRNDLGRCCDYGSVKVTQPRTIETHPTIHHGVATIQGRLHRYKDLIDLLRATLPGGSITGAPKIRAMQIIDELEPVRRGPYCGAIGLIHGRSMRLNIAIRTLLIEKGDGPLFSASDAYPDGRVDFSVGGGIVADSNPASEYDETLAKARAMLDALNTRITKKPG